MSLSIFKIESEEEYLANKDTIDINELKPDGKNALFFSPLLKCLWMVKHGINVNQVDDLGRNVIFYSQYIELKEFGLDINHLDNDGHSAFYKASRSKIKALVKAGFDFEKHSDLSYLDYDQTKDLITHLPVEIIDKLTFNTTATNKLRNNPLFGINQLSNKSVEILINKGFSVHHLNKEKRNPLFMADVDKTKILIEKGAKPDFIDKYNKNMLFYIKDIELLKFFLSQNFSNKNICSERTGKNALFGASYEKTLLLLENGFSVKDINIQDKIEKETPLFGADAETAKLLIEKGANVNIISKRGRTALFDADLEKTKVLVEAGINVNIEDNRNENALWVASSPDVEDYLIRNGATLPLKIVERYKDFHGDRIEEILKKMAKIEKVKLLENMTESNEGMSIKKRI